MSLIISVQNSYITHVTSDGVLTCDNIIKIPLCCTVTKRFRVDGNEYDIIPCVEIITPIDVSGLKIITNEGVTVEPFSTEKLPLVANPYSTNRLYFVLPQRTTGIKTVIVERMQNGYTVNMEFGIMPPPYCYDNALPGVIVGDTQFQYNLIEGLTHRVDALESKRLYVKQVPLKSYPGFFKIFGTNDQNGILGWEFAFKNTGNLLSLTSGDFVNYNVIISDADITECKKLALTYDKGSSIFSLYAITEGVTGYILDQRFLASGLGKTTGAPQDLHLLIDGSPQNVLNIGSGFVSHI